MRKIGGAHTLADLHTYTRIATSISIFQFIFLYELMERHFIRWRNWTHIETKIKTNPYKASIVLHMHEAVRYSAYVTEFPLWMGKRISTMNEMIGNGVARVQCSLGMFALVLHREHSTNKVTQSQIEQADAYERGTVELEFLFHNFNRWIWDIQCLYLECRWRMHCK